MNIYLVDIKTNKAEILTTQQLRNIKTFYWKNNDSLIYLLDSHENKNQHVFLIDINTKEKKDITPGEKLKVERVFPLNDKVYLENKKEFKDKILVVHNGGQSQTFDLYQYDIKTGESIILEKLAKNEEIALLNLDTINIDYKYKNVGSKQQILRANKVVYSGPTKEELTILGYASRKKDKLYVSFKKGTAYFIALTDLNLNNIKKPKDKNQKDSITSFNGEEILTSVLNLNYQIRPFLENRNGKIFALGINDSTKAPEYAIHTNDTKIFVHYFDKKAKAKNDERVSKLIKKYQLAKNKTLISEIVPGSKEEIIYFRHYGYCEYLGAGLPTPKSYYHLPKNDLFLRIYIP